MPRILSRSDVEQLLSMEEVIEAVEEGFRTCAREPYHIPVRLPLDVPDRQGVVLFMPAYLPGSGAMGAKIVSVFPQNPNRNIPTIIGVYLLLNHQTGELLAVMDATHITGMRTAAASAVATRHLSNAASKTLGIIGAGVQARFHLRALTGMRRFEEIVIYNRSKSNGENMIREMREELAVPLRFVETADACVRCADVIATCTRSSLPVFNGKSLQTGTHINAVGAFTPKMRELDDSTILKSTLIVDTYEGALAEAGDILIPIRNGLMDRSHIRGELSEIISGRKPGRTSKEEITVFKSVGFAMEDAVTAKLVYEKAIANGVGVDVEI